MMSAVLALASGISAVWIARVTLPACSEKECWLYAGHIVIQTEVRRGEVRCREVEVA